MRIGKKYVSLVSNNAAVALCPNNNRNRVDENLNISSARGSIELHAAPRLCSIRRRRSEARMADHLAHRGETSTLDNVHCKDYWRLYLQTDSEDCYGTFGLGVNSPTENSPTREYMSSPCGGEAVESNNLVDRISPRASKPFSAPMRTRAKKRRLPTKCKLEDPNVAVLETKKRARRTLNNANNNGPLNPKPSTESTETKLVATTESSHKEEAERATFMCISNQSFMRRRRRRTLPSIPCSPISSPKRQSSIRSEAKQCSKAFLAKPSSPHPNSRAPRPKMASSKSCSIVTVDTQSSSSSPLPNRRPSKTISDQLHSKKRHQGTSQFKAIVLPKVGKLLNAARVIVGTDNHSNPKSSAVLSAKTINTATAGSTAVRLDSHQLLPEAANEWPLTTPSTGQRQESCQYEDDTAPCLSPDETTNSSLDVSGVGRVLSRDNTKQSIPDTLAIMREVSAQSGKVKENTISQSISSSFHSKRLHKAFPQGKNDTRCCDCGDGGLITTSTLLKILGAESIGKEPNYEKRRIRAEVIHEPCESVCDRFIDSLRSEDVSPATPASALSIPGLDCCQHLKRSVSENDNTHINIKQNDCSRRSSLPHGADSRMQRSSIFLCTGCVKSTLEGRGVGVVCQKGLKSSTPNQDDFFIIQDRNMAAFAVFDGHGPWGHKVSNAAAAELCEMVLNSAKNSVAPAAALRHGYSEVQIRLKAAARKSSQDKFCVNMSGSTATVVYVQRQHETNQVTVTASHVGDSRAVLGHRSKIEPRKHEAFNLTEDHRPTNAIELDRIIRSGGEVRKLENDVPHRVFLRGRLYPGLAMSRALGDLIAARAGVTCEPDISEFRVDPDGFILLCSDGVWEFISSQEAVDLVAKYLDEGFPAQEAAEKLADESQRRWFKEEEGLSVDDITVVVVQLQKCSKSC